MIEEKDILAVYKKPLEKFGFTDLSSYISSKLKQVMNLDEIRKRMDRLQNKSNGKSSSDFKKNFWKPPSGEKSVVRIVPYKHNKDVPFYGVVFLFWH